MHITYLAPRLDAGIVAATLRGLGYAARSYRARRGDGDPPAFGVAIHIVCTEAWRYPDGRWEIIDHPAHVVAVAQHRWVYNGGVAVPEARSACSLAAWVAAQLPPPERPEFRVYWQFTPPAPPPATAPAGWADQWREHWSRGGTDLVNPAEHIHHGAAP